MPSVPVDNPVQGDFLLYRKRSSRIFIPEQSQTESERKIKKCRFMMNW